VEEVSRVALRALLLCLFILLLVVGDGQLFSQQAAKDLVPLSITFSPPSPVRKGDIIKVTTEVENRGSQPVGYPETITVQFIYIGATGAATFDTVTKETVIIDPDSSATFEARLDTVSLTAGNYRIRVDVDPMSRISDEYRGNNTLITPVNSPLQILEGPTKPDLSVSDILFTPGSIIAQGAVKSLIIAATVGNAGTLDANPSEVEFSYRLRGESLFHSVSVVPTAKIQRGEEKSAFLTEDVSDWPAGVYIVRAQVDPQNRQDELDNGNNLLTRFLFILDSSRKKWSYPPFSIPFTETAETVVTGDWDIGKPIDWAGSGIYEDVNQDSRVSAGDKRLKEVRIGAIASGATAAIVKEGNQDKTVIYFGSDDGHLYALYTDGTERWRYPSQGGAVGAIKTTPEVAQGKVYFGSDDGHLYVVDSSGSLSWQYPTMGAIGAVKAAPALLTDGTGAVEAIYFGSDDGSLYALNPDGSLRWKFPTGAFIRATPAITTVTEGGAQKTLIYFGSGDGLFYALEDQGNEALLRWTFPTGSFIKSSPQILNETVYFGSSDGHLYALFLDGTKKWQYPRDIDRPIGAVESTPLVVEEDGTAVIYFGSNDGSLYKVEDQGDEGAGQWRFKDSEGVALGPVRSSPLRQGELIYFGSDDGALYVVRDRGASVSDEWTFPTRGAISGSLMIDENTLYLPSWEGHLYALNLQ
jgi:outer membrane protein assembly factor BamB